MFGKRILWPLLVLLAACANPNPVSKPETEPVAAAPENNPEDAGYAACISAHHRDGSIDVLSGFVIKWRNGRQYMVTAGHITKPNRQPIKIIAFIRGDKNLGGFTGQELTLIATSDQDIAVLKFKNPTYIFRGREAKLGDSDKVAVGDTIFNIGSTAGIPFMMSKGRVGFDLQDSLVGKWHTKDKYRYLVHSALVMSGNSGGPVINERGEVVAMDVMRLVKGPGPDPNERLPRLGLSVPSNDIGVFLNKVITE